LIRFVDLPVTTVTGTVINSANDGVRLGSKIFVKNMHWSCRFIPTPGGVADYVENK
jgi:hypothetical protein